MASGRSRPGTGVLTRTSLAFDARRYSAYPEAVLRAPARAARATPASSPITRTAPTVARHRRPCQVTTPPSKPAGQVSSRA
jgi:hypothetical protein